MKQVRATPEWHYYCPKCERSNCSRIHKIPEKRFIIIGCVDCGEKYEVVPQNDLIRYIEQKKKK